MITFKTYIGSLKDCEQVTSTSTKEGSKNDGSQKVLVKDEGTSKEAHGTVYMKNVYEFLRKQDGLCEREEIMWHPERKRRMSEVISPSMTSSVFHRCYGKVREEVIRSF